MSNNLLELPFANDYIYILAKEKERIEVMPTKVVKK